MPLCYSLVLVIRLVHYLLSCNSSSSPNSKVPSTKTLNLLSPCINSFQQATRSHLYIQKYKKRRTKSTGIKCCWSQNSMVKRILLVVSEVCKKCNVYEQKTSHTQVHYMCMLYNKHYISLQALTSHMDSLCKAES